MDAKHEFRSKSLYPQSALTTTEQALHGTQEIPEISRAVGGMMDHDLYDPRGRRMPNWLRRRGIGGVLGYSLAVLSAAGAFFAARAFLHFHLPLAFMSFSFCAIAITFWYGGVGLGILAAVLVVLIRTFVFFPKSI